MMATTGQMDLELSLQSQRSNTKEAELVSAKEEVSLWLYTLEMHSTRFLNIILKIFLFIIQIKRLESEFASYKSRAHALLQRKDAELASAKDNEQLKALEEALKVYLFFIACFSLLCDDEPHNNLLTVTILFF